MRTFAVVNQKGGCGKTTTAINLAGVFASRGFRTLLVDMDPQGHCAAGLAIPEQRVDLHIGDAMLAPDEQPVDPKRLLWRVSRNLDLAPSTLGLAALEAARGDLANRPDAESRLKRVLARFDRGYDVCLIDCSPAIGLLAFNALVAADEIVIPVETGFFSLQGANKQVNAIKSLGKRLGVAPQHNLLATMHDPSSVLSQDLLDELRRRFNGRVLPIVIRYDQALREAASFGQPVIEYSPESSGAKDYSALAEHLIAQSIRPCTGNAGDSRAMADFGITPPSVPAVPSVAPVTTTKSVVGSRGSLTAALTAAKLAPILGESDMQTVAVVDLSGSDDAIRPVRSTKHHEPHAEVSSPLPAEPKSIPTGVALISTVDLAARTRQLQRAAAINEGHLAKDEATSPKPEVRVMHERPRETTPIARPFGVIVEGGIAVFRQPASVGRSVAVAGDFNGWQPDRTPMKLLASQEIFEAVAPLGDRPAQYRIVIDGHWMPDPFNPSVAPNPFGGSNSIAQEAVRPRAE